MKIISIGEFHDLHPNLGEDELILDVRSPGEYSEGHIKGSKNTDHEQVGSIADELKNYKNVFVHCKMGGRAKIASQTLENMGLTNIICVGDGGMQRWMELGWPVEM